jgi:hypothetical protein
MAKSLITREDRGSARVDVDLSGALQDTDERAFFIRIYSILSAHFFNPEEQVLGVLGVLGALGVLGVLGYTHLESRLQLNHIPVHETHNVKVRNRERISKTQSLTRTVTT